VRPKIKGKVVAILCSDLHLSHKKPIARHPDEDWYRVMSRYLQQLDNLKTKHNALVIYAGDIFDKSNPPPELINFAIERLPRGIAIPGQHDLPLHNYSDIGKSGYWTLYKAGIIDHLDEVILNRGVAIYPFPWGYPIVPRHKVQLPGKDQADDPDFVHLAVCHQYIWTQNHKYPGAPEQQRVPKVLPLLKGYDAAVFGDNHKGFICNQIINCGTFIRRKRDEIDYKPMVGLLTQDGSIHRHYLNTKKDRFADVDQLIQRAQDDYDADEFINELITLGKSGLDFRDAMIQLLNNDNSVSKKVRKIVLEAMETKE
jgi:hypothetical protein